MIYNDINHIRASMNKSGKEHLPFLFVLNFEMTEGYFIENPLQQSDILFSVNGVGNKPSALKAIRKPDNLTFFPITPNDYKIKYDIVHEGLRRGDSFLTNLTVKTPIDIDIPMEDIFMLSRSPYQLYIPDNFVCFSPERFVKIADNIISTNPMKGTIDASIANARQVILDDFKETAEHNTIVDLLRNDLSMSASKVEVKRFRYIDCIKTQKKEILQVSSEITGELPPESFAHLGDIIFKMLPAGSVSGAPKASTVDIIQRAEKEPRGYYTGIMGYFDGTTFDSAVLIRYIEKDNGNYYFRSGGGITVYSNWEDEYDEVLNKIYYPF